MEDLEYAQNICEDSLPDVVPLDAGENSSNYESNESVAEGGDK